VASGDIHVNGETSIGCELSRWNERDQTEDLRADPGKRDGFRPGHGDMRMPMLDLPLQAANLALREATC